MGSRSPDTHHHHAASLQVLLTDCLCIRLEVVFTGATMGIVVKSSKTLLDALSSVLQKHGLRPQDVVVTTVRRGTSAERRITGTYGPQKGRKELV